MFFQQDSAIRTPQTTVCIVYGVSGGSIIKRKLWPPDLLI